MAKLSLVSIGLYVRDRKKAAEWYVAKLGAKIVSDDEDHWTTVRVGPRGAEIHLCEKGEGPYTPEDFGESGILFLTDEDIKSVHRELSAKGVKFSLAPEKFPWGWTAKFLDLDGNEFCLMPKADG